MIALGKGLTLYISMCTVTTAFFLLLGNINDKFFKTKEQLKKEKEEFEEWCNQNSEEMLAIRRVFGDLKDDETQWKVIAFLTYFPGLNFIVWKDLLKGIFQKGETE